LVPADAGALHGRRTGAANQVDFSIKRDGGGSTPRALQGSDRGPLVRRDIVEIRVRIGIAVLLDEAAERVNAPRIRNDRDMLGGAWQRRSVEPEVVFGIVDVVIGAVDASFAIAADDMHAARPRRRPGHLAARQRQRGFRSPAALRPLWRRAFRLALADL